MCTSPAGEFYHRGDWCRNEALGFTGDLGCAVQLLCCGSTAGPPVAPPGGVRHRGQTMRRCEAVGILGRTTAAVCMVATALLWSAPSPSRAHMSAKAIEDWG